ncbi:MAG: hypothetical protein KDB21_12620 [Acidimicrobiales bacterium]|nr:hypothetical protein [Acidimicrobiales bacterium]
MTRSRSPGRTRNVGPGVDPLYVNAHRSPSRHGTIDGAASNTTSSAPSRLAISAGFTHPAPCAGTEPVGDGGTVVVAADGPVAGPVAVPAPCGEQPATIADPINADDPSNNDRRDNPTGASRPPRTSRVSVTSHRPIIEPFIIQLFQSPFMCWRIQVTMSSHHDADGTPLAPDWTHDRQLDSIRSGSPHTIEPIIWPLVTRWFIHAVMSPHQLVDPDDTVVVAVVIHVVHAAVMFATCADVDA